MRLADLYRRPGRTSPVISYELFPPRVPDPHSAPWAGIVKLLNSRPEYVSVTFGASGSSQELSRTVLCQVLQRTGRPGLAHLTCVGRNQQQLDRLISELIAEGIRDFLALRGDPPRGQSRWVSAPGGLSRAAELVELIREVSIRELGDPAAVSVAVAAYPAGTIQTRTDAIAALVEKQSAGADFAITQVFYRAVDYRDLVQAAACQGVQLPIVPGIIPFTDINRLRRLQALSGVPVPPELAALADLPDPGDRLRATLAATLGFLDQLLCYGAPGLHFYTFNRTRPTLDLVEHLRSRRFAHVEAAEAAALLELTSANLTRLAP